MDELACKDGNPVPQEFYPNAEAICKRADKLRELLGVPLHVNSGYRTAAYNKHVGGKPHSEHLTASALDLRCHEWTPAQMADLYEGLIRLGIVPDGGIGRYDSFIHIDIGKPRRWRG